MLCVALSLHFTLLSFLSFQPILSSKSRATYIQQIMSLTRDELRCWSRYIRDVLAPNVVHGSEDAISRITVESAHSFLADLYDTVISLDVLKFSKVHMALMEIASPGSGWSPAVTLKAEKLLLTWNENFGDLQAALKIDLWGPGGRMEGVVELDESMIESPEPNQMNDRKDSSGTRSSTGSKVISSPWIVVGGKGPLYALSIGHNGFEIGEYWN